MNDLTLWNKYKKITNLDKDEIFSGTISFEAKGFGGNERIASVLAGKKRAAFSSYATYAIDNEPLPISGEIYVLEDSEENALCLIQINAVEILPFNQVTWQMAQLEGEDENLEQWKEKQREYLQDEADIVGFTFSEDMKIVFMEFSVIYK